MWEIYEIKTSLTNGALFVEGVNHLAKGDRFSWHVQDIESPTHTLASDVMVSFEAAQYLARKGSRHLSHPCVREALKGERSEHEANELVLYLTTSNQALYKRHMTLESYLDMQYGYLSANTRARYVREHFRSLIDATARAYCKEYACPIYRFSSGTRELATDEITDTYLSGARRDGTVKSA